MQGTSDGTATGNGRARDVNVVMYVDYRVKKVEACAKMNSQCAAETCLKSSTRLRALE